MLRSVSLPPLLLLSLAGLALGDGLPIAVEVTAPVEVLAGEGPQATVMGFVKPGQLYVLHAAGSPGGRAQVRFSAELGWIARAALMPLPDHPLYMIAASSDEPLPIELDNGTLVAPAKMEGDKALLHFEGQEVWIPRAALRGPVELRRPGTSDGRRNSAARSTRDRARGASTGTNSGANEGEPGTGLVSSPTSGATGAGTGAGAGTGTGSGAGTGATTEARPEQPAPTRPRGNGRVDYQGKRVSSQAVRDFLQRLADLTGRTVRVTSGDRNHVPRGGSRTSLHLHHRAADFSVQGQTLEQTWNLIRANRDELFAGGSFELVWHQAGTNTSGPHLHVGNYPTNRGLAFKTETGGRYRRVP